jgi:hypothetical protein
MVDLYSLAASATARKEAEVRAARKAYGKRKTRAAQVAVLLEGTVQVATDAAAAAPHPVAAATPQQQTAWTAPGGAGSRAGLLPHPTAAVPVAAPVATTAAALERI